MHFEQCEPSTEDNVVQVNVGDEANSKPVFISESFPSNNKDNLLTLIQEYINVFDWNYKNMPGLDPYVSMHRLNITPDAKPVKEHQSSF